MKEIVWVVGHSGVGKETFCRFLTGTPDAQIVEQLGWAGLRIGLCGSSIAAVPRGHDKKKQDDRDKIVDELTIKQGLIDVMLLKWQALDHQKGRVMAVDELFKGATTRALVLEAEDQIVQERHLSRENTWEPEGGWKSFLSHEDDVIEKALDDFKVINYIDTNNSYKLIG